MQNGRRLGSIYMLYKYIIYIYIINIYNKYIYIYIYIYNKYMSK